MTRGDRLRRSGALRTIAALAMIAAGTLGAQETREHVVAGDGSGRYSVFDRVRDIPADWTPEGESCALRECLERIRGKILEATTFRLGPDVETSGLPDEADRYGVLYFNDEHMTPILGAFDRLPVPIGAFPKRSGPIDVLWIALDDAYAGELAQYARSEAERIGDEPATGADSAPEGAVAGATTGTELSAGPIINPELFSVSAVLMQRDTSVEFELSCNKPVAALLRTNTMGLFGPLVTDSPFLDKSVRNVRNVAMARISCDEE